MRHLLTFLLLSAIPVSAQNPTVKECLNDINNSVALTGAYLPLPFSNDKLTKISNLEDKLSTCANLPNADSRLLFSLFDAELRISGIKQVWVSDLAKTELRRISRQF